MQDAHVEKERWTPREGLTWCSVSFVWSSLLLLIYPLSYLGYSVLMTAESNGFLLFALRKFCT